MNAGDLFVLPDYQGHVKNRIFHEPSETIFHQLEDRHYYPTEYEEALEAYLVGGWQSVDRVKGSNNQLAYPVPKDERTFSVKKQEKVGAHWGKTWVFSVISSAWGLLSGAR